MNLSLCVYMCASVPITLSPGSKVCVSIIQRRYLGLKLKIEREGEKEGGREGVRKGRDRGRRMEGKKEK